ncbi:uncharacterized protein G2W53_030541 [Senna tora]|uniref:Uncharacterized protein n=1 Tax=Senna tora TaxID=362788 RepID=A0A834T9C7_9FABA|nr:uncharacterized protein G2W53_030541 [Senna tora]
MVKQIQSMRMKPGAPLAQWSIALKRVLSLQPETIIMQKREDNRFFEAGPGQAVLENRPGQPKSKAVQLKTL